MKAIIPAAGYATRLYPLTENTPKPLLKINNKAMLDYVVEKILDIGIKDIVVVSNNKFFDQFKKWASEVNFDANIRVYNDNTMTNEDRLGAIGDIQFAIKEARIDDDVLVVGADNIFDFGLDKAYKLFLDTQKTTIIDYDVQDIDKAKKYGIIAKGLDNRVTSFAEKPENPLSTLAAICVYFYPKHVVPRIKEYLDRGLTNLDAEKYKKRKDAPGNFPAWLIDKDAVYSQTHQEAWFDVGSFDSLEEAKRYYGGHCEEGNDEAISGKLIIESL